MSHRLYACEICEQPISRRRYRAGRLCGSRRCRLLAARAFWERVRQGKIAGRDEMQKAARRLLPAAKRKFGVDPGAFLPLVVPANSSRIVNLPERRKRAFREHLMLRISAASALLARQRRAEIPDDAIDPIPSEVESAVLLNACATCKGRCCKPGYNTALIRTNTVLRVMQENPDLRPRDVLEAYLSRLPAKAYEHSCVYHTAQGCALPRQMRSTTCNHFLCSNLQEMRQQIAETQSSRFFLIASAGKSPERAAFVDGAACVPVSTDLPAAGESKVVRL